MEESGLRCPEIHLSKAERRGEGFGDEIHIKPSDPKATSVFSELWR